MYSFQLSQFPYGNYVVLSVLLSREQHDVLWNVGQTCYKFRASDQQKQKELLNQKTSSVEFLPPPTSYPR